MSHRIKFESRIRCGNDSVPLPCEVNRFGDAESSHASLSNFRCARPEYSRKLGLSSSVKGKVIFARNFSLMFSRHELLHLTVDAFASAADAAFGLCSPRATALPRPHREPLPQRLFCSKQLIHFERINCFTCCTRMSATLSSLFIFSSE